MSSAVDFIVVSGRGVSASVKIPIETVLFFGKVGVSAFFM